jgi:multidrug efflux pump subunit AcrB
MRDELMIIDPEVKQPSTFGKPRRKHSAKFHRFYAAILDRVVGVLRVFTIVFAAIIAGLVLYLTFGVEKVNLYSSDGTIFACRLYPTSARN